MLTATPVPALLERKGRERSSWHRKRELYNRFQLKYFHLASSKIAENHAPVVNSDP